MCSIYPAPFSITLALAHVDLADAQTIDAVLRSFRRQLKDEVDHVPYFHRPPLLGGVAYDINSYAELNGARQHDIFRAIDLSDHLLIRGLGALIQSAMLGRYSEFLESACMSLWVAMAASLELVWRRLRSEGNNNPNSKDAAAYLAAAFQSQHVPERYFEEFYEDRIRTVHPVSRFGVYPAAPLSADAFYDLYDSLVPTYDFLITGHIRQDFVEL